jgi:hypothetical protein
MHRKDNFSDHVPFGEALIRLVSPGEGVAFRDRNLEPRGLHRRGEALEFPNPGNTVVSNQCHAAPPLLRRLDAVGMRNAAAGLKHIQASLQRVSTGES